MANEGKEECLFCAILNKKVPAISVYEDGDSLAFLDINPRAKGMTIVVPKKHYDHMHDDFLSSLKTFQAAENVSQMIMQSLGAENVEIATIPAHEVHHFHFRLYPTYGNENPLVEATPIKMKEEELHKMAKLISSASVEIFASAAKKQEPEVELSQEDAEYIRRQTDRA